jgi:hypothetical protein
VGELYVGTPRRGRHHPLPCAGAAQPTVVGGIRKIHNTPFAFPHNPAGVVLLLSGIHQMFVGVCLFVAYQHARCVCPQPTDQNNFLKARLMVTDQIKIIGNFLPRV